MSFPRYPKYKPSGVEWLGEGITFGGRQPRISSTNGASHTSPGQRPGFLFHPHPSPEGAFQQRILCLRSRPSIARPFRAQSFFVRDSQGVALGWYGLPLWGVRAPFTTTDRILTMIGGLAK
jgi:hypothetical protein